MEGNLQTLCRTESQKRDWREQSNFRQRIHHVKARSGTGNPGGCMQASRQRLVLVVPGDQWKSGFGK